MAVELATRCLLHVFCGLLSPLLLVLLMLLLMPLHLSRLVRAHCG